MKHIYTETHTLELSHAEYRTLRDVVAFHHSHHADAGIGKNWASILAGFELDGDDGDYHYHTDCKEAYETNGTTPCTTDTAENVDPVAEDDLLYCRKHGRAHNSSCVECGRYLRARIAYSKKIKTPNRSTSELVEMLKGREGVSSNRLCGSLHYDMTVSAKGPLSYVDIFNCLPVPESFDGPATILVVKEDAE